LVPISIVSVAAGASEWVYDGNLRVESSRQDVTELARSLGHANSTTGCVGTYRRLPAIKHACLPAAAAEQRC
jgi:hypothetical protein